MRATICNAILSGIRENDDRATEAQDNGEAPATWKAPGSHHPGPDRASLDGNPPVHFGPVSKDPLVLAYKDKHYQLIWLKEGQSSPDACAHGSRPSHYTSIPRGGCPSSPPSAGSRQV